MKFIKKKISELSIELIDGDRGKNYPKKNEFLNKGDCVFLNAKNVTSNDFCFEEINFITKEKDKLLNNGKLKRKDIVLTTRGTVGNVAYYSEKIPFECMRINSGMIIIRCQNSINEKYIYWYMRTKQFKNQIKELQTGSAQPQLPLSIIKNMVINICNMKNQNKIVYILDKIQEKINLNTHINNNLYEMCNKIYHNYLKQYSNLIKYKKIRGISKKIVTGKTPLTRNEMFWNGKIPFITIPDMHNQVFITSTERNITECGAKAIIPKNSILVSCIATVGLVSISTEKSQTNQQINSIILENDYDLYFLFEFLSEQRNLLKNIAGGSTTYNINKHTFENIEVPCLSKEKLIEFNNIVADMFEKIKLNQNENKTLEQLRDILLPKLMNGEIDLDKIEI